VITAPGLGADRMDLFDSWLHNTNVDRTLNRLGTYVDPTKRTTLMKFLIREEDKLGADLEQLERTALRVREGKTRISRTLAIIQGLVEHDLMNEEKFSKAMDVLDTMNEIQHLIEQRYRRILRQTSYP
jgi:hypothetical protein